MSIHAPVPTTQRVSSTLSRQVGYGKIRVERDGDVYKLHGNWREIPEATVSAILEERFPDFPISYQFC